MIVALPGLFSYLFVPYISVACETIPDTSGGTFTLLSSGTITRASYTCPERTTINGEAVLTCNSDGSWGVVSFPTCGTNMSIVTKTCI